MPPKKSNDEAFSDNVTTVKAWIEATKGKDKKAVVNKTYTTDGKKHTMLYRACRLGRFEVAKMLVEDFGADVNVQNGGEDKSVPLHGACELRWRQAKQALEGATISPLHTIRDVASVMENNLYGHIISL